MTNYEHYKDDDEFMKIVMTVGGFRVDKNNVVKPCGVCKDCIFADTNERCSVNRLEWLNKEYNNNNIDWSKVEVDACVLVKDKNDDEWKKRHFAEYKCETNINGKYKVHTYPSGYSSWTCNNMNTVPWEMAQLIEIGED